LKGNISGRLLGERLSNDLAHAFVVEKCGNAAGSNEDCDAIAQHERLGVIDLKAISVN
jgi:hypothetical protein